MAIPNFEQIIQQARDSKKMTPASVACAEEEHVLEAVIRAWKEKIIQPWLVGDRDRIKALLKERDESFPDEFIVGADDKEKAAFKAVQLIREGRAAYLIKGLIETSVIVRALLNKETGLPTGRTLSHMSITHIPGHRKLLVITDAAIIISPDLSQKADIIQNAVNGLRALGYDRPKVAVLTSIETVNPKMPESVEAAELKKKWEAGEITGCCLEGPIALDLALNAEAAAVKGYQSEVVGDADILVMPNMVSGNILVKALREFADSTSVGVVQGAGAPMVLSSRGASVRTKYTAVVVVSQMV
ncbi:MAG: phosphate butyryltransferase [Candidatus Adiutrix sp.]|jgi:phosphate butyryltransferase|nr:phosphate butyryltransferase [Candidatus Adiutrix sp.]